MSNRSRPFPHHAEGSGLNDDALAHVRVRHPEDADQRYADGSFATGNTAALTHGGEARKTRTRLRREKHAELRKHYAAEDGSLDPAVDMLLWQIAGVQSVSDIALSYVEKSSHSIGSGKVERGVDVYLNSAQAQARLLDILGKMTAAKGIRGGSMPGFRIVHVTDDDYRDGVLERLNSARGSGQPGMQVDALAEADVARIRASRDEDWDPAPVKPQASVPSLVLNTSEPVVVEAASVHPVDTPTTSGQDTASLASSQPVSDGRPDADLTSSPPEEPAPTPTPSRAVVGRALIERLL
jgi:hypothetical protein